LDDENEKDDRRRAESRGIAPEIINAVVDKIEEKSSIMPDLLAIATTGLICTLIFVVIWESTP
jgi:hypothetical protein